MSKHQGRGYCVKWCFDKSHVAWKHSCDVPSCCFTCHGRQVKWCLPIFVFYVTQLFDRQNFVYWFIWCIIVPTPVITICLGTCYETKLRYLDNDIDLWYFVLWLLPNYILFQEKKFLFVICIIIWHHRRRMLFVLIRGTRFFCNINMRIRSNDFS